MTTDEWTRFVLDKATTLLTLGLGAWLFPVYLASRRLKAEALGRIYEKRGRLDAAFSDLFFILRTSGDEEYLPARFSTALQRARTATEEFRRQGIIDALVLGDRLFDTAYDYLAASWEVISAIDSGLNDLEALDASLQSARTAMDRLAKPYIVGVDITHLARWLRGPDEARLPASEGKAPASPRSVA